MSLAKKLRSIEKPRRHPNGCQTCQWLARRTDEEREAIYEWLRSGYSIRQLHSICASEPDPLAISESAFKNHLRDCERPS